MPANSLTDQFDGGIFSIKVPNSVFNDWGLQFFGLQNSWPAPLLWLCHHSRHSFSSGFVSTPFHTFYHYWWDSYDPGTSSILGPSLLPMLNLQQWPLRTSLQRLLPCQHGAKPLFLHMITSVPQLSNCRTSTTWESLTHYQFLSSSVSWTFDPIWPTAAAFWPWGNTTQKTSPQWCWSLANHSWFSSTR